MNTRSGNIEGMVKENSLQTEGLKKTTDYICSEIKNVKGKVCDLEDKVRREGGQLPIEDI